ncbi:Aldehyde/histidinol dehydrogenase [Pseudomassariella vexata]|uniref:aldehyde dehydrogenase (NAD(+)) n=1 Tax=Pseudomassariella vexata TaxID=1141098 RepID=A0A1Y2DCJ9_9PEZI|nr:Aldehyde/histidinol dehydrogenase [Pseudomassariella vexata]ORY56989.1 Aldehyde/histidinol dehydrogenase [Pseudomassariella vexata]
MEFFNIIDGKPRTAKEFRQESDPRTEDKLWDAPVATVQDLDDAVAAAQKAFKTWRWSTVFERQKLIQAVTDLVTENLELLAEILMKETGKSKLLATIEVERAAAHYKYYTKVALEDEVQFEDSSVKILATHAPYGVIGAISPWNFPLILSTIKVVSALATGNCVIIKPSPFTPYTMLKFCELAQSILPPGVFQTLNGGADLGEKMTLHPGISHISFTGTIGVGKRIMENCAKSLKKMILELAGNDAAVVCEDVDLAEVVPKIAEGCLYHAGQMCVATKRVYVHEELFDQFLEMLGEEVKKFAPSTDAYAPSIYGPLSNPMNYERCQSFIDDCRKNNYKIAAGGESKISGKGYWIAPTIVVKPPEDSLVVSEEQFGPIIPVMTWSSEDDVLSRANLDNAGLGAVVYSKDLDRAQSLARRLEVGTVWINTPAIPHQGGFFSGQKQSGVGGELGKQGLLSYCHTQSILIAK